MAEQEEAASDEIINPTFPPGRIKRMMKLDKDINKINSEALFLVSCSLDLFIESLAKRSAQVALEKKRKTVNLDYLRIAVKRHQPTSDFLLDSLPMPCKSSPAAGGVANEPSSSWSEDKALPFGTRRIDQFFHKGS
ncbi:Nuclear transcription factor Y subunit C [Heracleum sosnowskyi]|uniref:Nuclear transcription factor Y subunit C n=1 Tax=Heracleum sosnowskyi TaxID=360622 RepID=A0AAD8JF39_9APIA|nr:Nuclear transcription factor Y subunit C [Heracleum sosnowskyi]